MGDLRGATVKKTIHMSTSRWIL